MALTPALALSLLSPYPRVMFPPNQAPPCYSDKPCTFRLPLPTAAPLQGSDYSGKLVRPPPAHTPLESPLCLPGFGWLPPVPTRKSLCTGSCRGWEGKRGMDEMLGARPTKWASLEWVRRAPQVRLAGYELDLESGKGTLA